MPFSCFFLLVDEQLPVLDPEKLMSIGPCRFGGILLPVSTICLRRATGINQDIVFTAIIMVRGFLNYISANPEKELTPPVDVI